MPKGVYIRTGTVIPWNKGKKCPSITGELNVNWKGGWKNKLPQCTDCGVLLTTMTAIRCRKHSLIFRGSRPPIRSGEQHPAWKGGKPNCEGCGIKLSSRKVNLCKKCYGPIISARQSGEKNHAWLGGISSLRDKIYRLPEHKELLADVKIRDRFTCQMCDNVGGKLETHHIERFSDIIRNHNIETVEQALRCQELFDARNLITLCEKCHDSVTMRESRFSATLRERIDFIYAEVV